MRRTNKDAFYFPHDSNAKDDIKCVELIGDLGLEGYGIYWVLIETLREQPEYKYPVKLLPFLARRFGVAPEVFQKVVFNFGLFVVEDDTIFFSESLIKRMALYEQKREQARNAGIESAKKRAKTTTVQQMFNDRSTDVQRKIVKYSRGNKSKENESIVNNGNCPTFEQVAEYIDQNEFVVDAGRFYNYYAVRNWRNIPDWRAKINEWNERDKLKTPPKGVTLGVGEYIENGRRTYGSGEATIPMSAPPRPSERYMWNAENNSWIL